MAGASFVGPLPDDIQNYTTYGAAASIRSPMREGAALFLKALVTPEASDVVRAKGMLPTY